MIAAREEIKEMMAIRHSVLVEASLTLPLLLLKHPDRCRRASRIAAWTTAAADDDAAPPQSPASHSHAHSSPSDA